jgi:alanine racemase
MSNIFTPVSYKLSTIASLIPNATLSLSESGVNASISELLFDSRSLLDAESTLFFALKTARNDGHHYIAQLYNSGVRAFVVGRDFADYNNFPDASFITVDSPAEALHQLATAHRKSFTIPVVAITGSRGKTMVKEWLYQLLSPSYRVARSPRSYNSSLGVPLSLWQISQQSEIALIEAGISQPGEMEVLQQMILPDIVVLTDIGQPHDEGFASRSEKIAEKLLLAREAKTLIYPANDADIAAGVKQALHEHRLPTDIKLVDSSIATVKATTTTLTEPWQQHNLNSCIATLTTLGIDSNTIAQRASQLCPMHTRLNVSEGVNHCLIIADDYTCDLHSLLPALDFLNRRATADRTTTLILSDIACENLLPDDTYKAAAHLCQLRQVNRIIGIGTEIARHANLFPEGSIFYSDINAALASLSTSDFSSELIMVKGMPNSRFSAIVQMLEARTHETVLEVNLDAMVSNYNFFRSFLRPETGIVAMVKASGYGAGSYELAKTLQNRGAAYLAVAVLDEGIDLRNAGITMPIMVLNPKVLNYPLLFANRLEPEIFDFNILNEIIAEARKLGVKNYPVHIKLDTGMHRLGFMEEDIDKVIDIIRQQDNISIGSVFSHLATADCLDLDSYTEAQLEQFNRCSQRIVDAFPYRIKRHILNTAGIMRYPQYQYDMVRLGIGLYGVPVINNGVEAPLRQVSTLRTVIIALKEREPSDTIGYGRRGRLTRHSLIATIPIGYADGINRHMGCGNVSFLVNGVKCPTVGNICMDICMIDVTDVPNVKVGDSVEIFGEDNPVGILAAALDTIPYELLTAVSPRVRRVYYSE